MKLGIDIGETSVSKYLLRRGKPPSQAWRTFLDNHMKSLVSVDFFTFQTLYVSLGRREFSRESCYNEPILK